MFERNAWVIADRDYWPLLLQNKEKNPNCNFKLLTKEDLLDLLTITYSADPIPLLMKEFSLDYLQAKNWASLLRVLWDSDSKVITEKKNIIKSCVKESSPNLILKKQGVVLFECEEDIEIQRILKNKGITYTFSSLDEVGIEPKWDGKSQVEILSFQNKFQQYFYLFSEIRKSLIENPELSKRIVVHIKDEADLFYLNLASNSFKIPVKASAKQKYISIPSVSEKLTEIHNKRDFSFTDQEKEDPNLDYLCSAIEKYGLKEMDFDRAYANLLEIIGGAGNSINTGDSGISATSNFNFSSNTLVYVTDFVYGSFHKVFDDKNVLADKDLAELGANPSYVKTALDKRKKWNYLRYINIASLSRVREHLSDAIYDSQFVENSSKLKTFATTKKDINSGGIYTESAKKLMQTLLCDRHHGHVDYFEGYDSYTGEFNGVSNWELPSKFSWSVSTLKNYKKCPFSFFVSRFLNINDESDYHSRYLGTFLHKVMENAYSKDFDYEVAYKEGVEAYKNHVKASGNEFTPREEVLLELYHDGFKKILERMLTWMEVSSIKDYSSEKEVHWILEDNGKTYRFKGDIDKIVYFENGNYKYYFLIDYKAGSNEDFAPAYVHQGYSIQLPLYAIAMEEGHSKDEKDLTHGFKFGGFGIQEIYFNNYKKAFTTGSKPNQMDEMAVLKNTSIEGIALKEREFWIAADNDETIFKKPDKNGECECKYDGLYISGKTVFDPETGYFSNKDICKEDPYYSWYDMKNDAKKVSLEMICHIENGDFPVLPSVSKPGQPIKNDNLNCRYCAYKDICYRDSRNLSSVVDSKKNMKSYFKADKRSKDAKKKEEVC